MFHRKKKTNVPEKHVHHKTETVDLSYKEPVIARVLVEKFRLTEDVVKKVPILMGYGNRRFCIENYSNIIEYTNERIRVQTKTGRIHLLGRNLVIAYFRDDGMCVIGDIHSIEYH